MELKNGQRLRVKEFDEIPSHWDFNGEMNKWMGKIVTFKEFRCNGNRIKIYEDENENVEFGWYWGLSDFQIVFDTWEDVKNAIGKECNKHNDCYGCPLNCINTGLCFSSVFYAKDYKKLTEYFEKMFGMECYVLEDEKMNFTLEDIKNEMIVKLRNGIVYISLEENFIGENGFMPKSKYLSNFKCRSNSNFDIVEVYEANKKYGEGFKGMLIIDEDAELLWKEINEPVTKDVSLEEINALLKEKYPDVEKFNLPIDNNK